MEGDPSVERGESPADDPIRVLVVDDQEGPREVLESALLERGCRVRAACNGREALGWIYSEPVDLVLADIKMPDINGIELLRRIREQFPRILVILITEYAGMDSAISAVREGAYDYLTKPFRVDALHVAVKNASDRIRLIRENKMLIDELKKSLEKMKEGGGGQGMEESARNLERLHMLQERALQIYTRKEGLYPE